MLRRAFSFACLALASAWPGNAQNAGVPVANFWLGPDKQIYSVNRERPVLEFVVKGKDGKAALEETELTLPSPKGDPRSSGLPHVSYNGWDGSRHWAVYAGPRSTTRQHGDHYPLALYASEDGRKWNLEGTWRQPWFSGASMVPLENGRFLAFVSTPPRETASAGKAPAHLVHPYFILERKGDRLVERDWMEPGLKLPLYKGTWMRGGHLRDALQYPNFNYSPSELHLAGKWIFHVWMSTGLIAVFDARDGHLARTAWIYSVDETALRSGRVGWAVLGYQVRPDGSLLLATREEAAVIAPREIHMNPLGQTDAMDHDAITRYLRDASEAIKVYPRVRWWTFDPDTGELHQESAPEGVPDRVDSVAAMLGFEHLRYHADGSLSFTHQKPKTPAPLPQVSKGTRSR